VGIAAATCLLFFAFHPAMAQSTTGHTPYYLGAPEIDIGWTPGESPASTPLEIEDISTSRNGRLNLGPVERPLIFLSKQTDALEKATGLQLAVAYTMPFMQATGSPGDRYGGAGDLHLISTWTLVGRDTKNNGQLIVTGDYRFKIGSQPPFALRGQVGTLIGISSGFNDRGWALEQAYWAQRLLDGRLRFIIGRADPGFFIGTHWLQSVDVSFMNRHFSGHPSMVAPGDTPLAGLSIRPGAGKLFYVTAATSNAYGETTKIELGSLFNHWDLFTFGEVGITPTFDKIGSGRYSVGVWHMAERHRDNLPADTGVTVSANQTVGDKLTLFARYGYSGATLGQPGSDVQHLAQGGVGARGLFGQLDDLPGDRTLRTEKVLEAFYRKQVTGHTQFSLGAQAIFDPSRAPTADTVGVFYARLRTTF
jgi:hypothetical protein